MIKLNLTLPSITYLYILTYIHAYRTIYLVRHGQSEYNVTDKLGGDSKLTEAGAEFARRLDVFMENESLRGYHFYEDANNNSNGSNSGIAADNKRRRVNAAAAAAAATAASLSSTGGADATGKLYVSVCISLSLLLLLFLFIVRVMFIFSFIFLCVFISIRVISLYIPLFISIC